MRTKPKPPPTPIDRLAEFNPELKNLAPTPFTASSKAEVHNFTHHLRLNLSDVVIVGDVHVPTTDPDLIERVLAVGKKTGIEHLIIAGDLVNFDSLSQFDHIVPPTSFDTEIATAKAVLEYWAQHYSITLMMGNHEERLLKRYSEIIRFADLYRILTDTPKIDKERFTFSPYRHLELTANSGLFRVTHPRNYSRIAGRIADQLSAKYHCNIISAHEHHLSLAMSTDNRYVCCNLGGLYDYTNMAYVMLADSTSATMSAGFVVMQNGVINLLNRHSALTDWGRWV